jgi:hypothetical protein
MYQIIEKNNTATTMSSSSLSSTAIVKIADKIGSARTAEAAEYKDRRVSIYAPSIGRIKDALTSKDKFVVLYDMDEDLYRRHTNEEVIRAVHLYFLSVDSSTERRHRDAMRQVEIAVRNDLSYGNENYARYYEKYKEYFNKCLDRGIEALHIIEFLAIEKQYRKKLVLYRKIKMRVKVISILLLTVLIGLLVFGIGRAITRPTEEQRLLSDGMTAEIIQINPRDLDRVSFPGVLDYIRVKYPYTMKYYSEKEVISNIGDLSGKINICAEVEEGSVQYIPVRVVHPIK